MFQTRSRLILDGMTLAHYCTLKVFETNENGHSYKHSSEEYNSKGNIVIGSSNPNKTIALLGVDNISLSKHLTPFCSVTKRSPGIKKFYKYPYEKDTEALFG